ncbi:MAG: hypothetical protein HYV07_34225 [Deltaproteobacteria bacterium]|nr:hypothetical protein [Deltaproteobacteria bacterium]
MFDLGLLGFGSFERISSVWRVNVEEPSHLLELGSSLVRLSAQSSEFQKSGVIFIH